MKLLFYIDRGGSRRSYETKTFIGFDDLNQSAFIVNEQYCYPTLKDEDGNDVLDEDGVPVDDNSDDAPVLDYAGDEVGITFGELAKGVGRINVDSSEAWESIESEDMEEEHMDAIIKYMWKEKKRVNLHLCYEEIAILKEIASKDDNYIDEVRDIFENFVIGYDFNAARALMQEEVQIWLNEHQEED